MPEPRSIRRAALMGDRREVLIQTGTRSFTIKDARDVLYKYSNFTEQFGEERRFFVPRSWFIHFVWRRFYPEHIYMKPYQDGERHLRCGSDWVQKDATEILLGLEQFHSGIKRFVNKAITAMVEKGLLEPKPEPARHDDTRYWLTDDGNLLATAAWSAPLSKEKADTLLQGILDRAIQVEHNPDDYLVRVTLLGVFGGYTDERVESINDLDILYDYERVNDWLSDDPEEKREKLIHQWEQRAIALFHKDGRTRRSIIYDHWSWPADKLKQFLRSRKAKLRIVEGSISRAIRLKVLYQYPHGVLKEPFFVDLPEGNHGPEWKALIGEHGHV